MRLLKRCTAKTHMTCAGKMELRMQEQSAVARSRAPSDVKMRSDTILTHVRSGAGSGNIYMKTELTIKGHSGETDCTGEEGRTSYKVPKGVKGLEMVIGRTMSSGTASVSKDRAAVYRYATLKAASSVVAACARAPGVVMRLALICFTLAPVSRATLCAGIVTEWATGVTPPRRHVLAIRGDDCGATHVAAMQIIGHLAAWLKMVGKSMGVNLGIFHAVGPLLALGVRVATERSGYVRGKGGPSGCIFPIYRGRATSMRALLELGLLRMEKGKCGT